MTDRLTTQLERARASVEAGAANVSKLLAPTTKLAEAQAQLDADRRSLADLETASTCAAANQTWQERLGALEAARAALEEAARGIAPLVEDYQRAQSALREARTQLEQLFRADRRLHPDGPGIALPDGQRVRCLRTHSVGKQAANLIDAVLADAAPPRRPARRAFEDYEAARALEREAALAEESEATKHARPLT